MDVILSLKNAVFHRFLGWVWARVRSFLVALEREARLMKLTSFKIGRRLNIAVQSADNFRRIYFRRPGNILPSVFIIGVQKCGTSSLLRYISESPQIQSAFRKEVHFFDLNYHHGFDWYRSFYGKSGKREPNAKSIAVDATPYYIFHPAVPERIHDCLPDAKFIVLMRNPIDRAVSHYWHEVQRGYEQLGLSDAFAAEEERLAGERVRLISDPSYSSFAHQHYSYVSRGLYGAQIEAWLRYFSREQFLFIRSEDLYVNPLDKTNSVLDFLGLDRISGGDFSSRNEGPGYEKGLPDDLRRTLTETFEADGVKLRALAGPEFTWSFESR